MSKQKIRLALKRKQKDRDQELVDFLAGQLGIDIESQAQNILAHPSPAGTRQTVSGPARKRVAESAKRIFSASSPKRSTSMFDKIMNTRMQGSGLKRQKTKPTQTHKAAPKCQTDAGSPRFDKNLTSTVSNILLTPMANNPTPNITQSEVTSDRSTTAQKSERQKAKKKITSADFLNMLSHGGRTSTAISNPTSV